MPPSPAGSTSSAPGYTAYGVPLGEAFQLRDDLLGAFGDGDKLGKDVGDDLRDGKPTTLHALARARATGADAALFAARMGHEDIDASDVAAIQRIMTETGARAEVEQTIDRLVAEALAALDEAPVGTAPARSCAASPRSSSAATSERPAVRVPDGAPARRGLRRVAQYGVGVLLETI